MKKIVLYILISLILNSVLTVTTVSANTNIKTLSLDTSNLIAINSPQKTKGATSEREYQPPLIYKPKTLPGPTIKQQESDSSKAPKTQKILSEILLPKAATGFIGFITMISFLMLIIAGVRFVVSYGNEEAVTKAKDQTIYAIVGLIIALLSYTIVSIIANLNIATSTTH